MSSHTASREGALTKTFGPAGILPVGVGVATRGPLAIGPRWRAFRAARRTPTEVAAKTGTTTTAIAAIQLLPPAGGAPATARPKRARYSGDTSPLRASSALRSSFSSKLIRQPSGQRPAEARPEPGGS